MAVGTMRKDKKFKVSTGIHTDQNQTPPRTWVEGEVVPSQENLSELFPNKFERVPRETPASLGRTNYKPLPPGMKRPKKQQKSQFDIEDEEDEAELDKESEEELEEEETEEEEDFLSQAVDASGRFPIIKTEAKSLRVMRIGKEYGVIEKKNPSSLLNTKGPLSREQVEPFVRSYLEAE